MSNSDYPTSTPARKARPPRPDWQRTSDAHTCLRCAELDEGLRFLQLGLSPELNPDGVIDDPGAIAAYIQQLREGIA